MLCSKASERKKISLMSPWPRGLLPASVLCKKRWYFIKHRKDCETALWAKKNFIESQPFIERKALLKERLYCNKEGLYQKSAFTVSQ